MTIGVILLALKNLRLILILFIVASILILLILSMIKYFCSKKVTTVQRPTPIQINWSSSLSPGSSSPNSPQPLLDGLNFNDEIVEEEDDSYNKISSNDFEEAGRPENVSQESISSFDIIQQQQQQNEQQLPATVEDLAEQQRQQELQRQHQLEFFSSLRDRVRHIDYNAQRLSEEEISDIRLYLFCLRITSLLNCFDRGSQLLNLQNNNMNHPNSNAQMLMFLHDDSNEGEAQQSGVLYQDSFGVTYEEIDNDAAIEFLMQKLDFYENLNKKDINQTIEQIPTYIFRTQEGIKAELPGDDIAQDIDENEIKGESQNKIYEEPKGARKSSKDFLCAICLMEFMDFQKIMRLQCNHEFHFDCAMEWLKSKQTCPLCKANIHI